MYASVYYFTQCQDKPSSCSECRIVGCSVLGAVSVYAFYERYRLPVNNNSRHYLAFIGTGKNLRPLQYDPLFVIYHNMRILKLQGHVVHY